jgi:hypothetical protein
VLVGWHYGSSRVLIIRVCTDKNENKIFLIYKEIQSGAVSKSYMRKGFLIFEEMGKYFPIYEDEEADSYITLQLLQYEFPYYRILPFVPLTRFRSATVQYILATKFTNEALRDT